MSKRKLTTYVRGGLGCGPWDFCREGWRLVKRELQEEGAAAASSVHWQHEPLRSRERLWVRNRLEEAPGRDHPLLLHHLWGAQGIIPSLQGLCLSQWPSSPLAEEGSPPGPGNSVQTRVTLFGEPVRKSGKFGESLLGEILIFGEREG